MYIENTTVVRYFDTKTKLGNICKKRRKKTVHKFMCDNCEIEFERDKGSISHTRLCNDFKHYCEQCQDPALYQKLGIASRRENLKALVGDTIIDECGYRAIYMGDTHPYSRGHSGRVREHILVMENHLKRTMNPGEVVHHIDGDKLNNELSNLDLCTVQEHNACHAASESIVFELYKKGVVRYNHSTKRYYLHDANQIGVIERDGS